MVFSLEPGGESPRHTRECEAAWISCCRAGTACADLTTTLCVDTALWAGTMPTTSIQVINYRCGT